MGCAYVRCAGYFSLYLILTAYLTTRTQELQVMITVETGFTADCMLPAPNQNVPRNVHASK
jgi:hypothetical protein